MNVNWVLADSIVLDPTVDTTQLKNLGSLWVSWRTWRSCQTDNVICNDSVKSADLIKREFQKTCNFYIPNSVYQQLNRPDGVRLYEGEFVHEVDHQEDIVAMHLAASSSDIVLLLGFDLTEKQPNPDTLLEHRARNYRGLVRQAIADNNQVQWLLVDHPESVMKEFANLENLSTDTMANVLTFSDS
jgi:hypothetical protein